LFLNAHFQSVIENYLIQRNKAKGNPLPNRPDFIELSDYCEYKREDYKKQVLQYKNEINDKVERILLCAYVIAVNIFTLPFLYYLDDTFDIHDWHSYSFNAEIFSQSWLMMLIVSLVIIGFGSSKFNYQSSNTWQILIDEIDQQIASLTAKKTDEENKLPTVNIGDIFGGGIVFHVEPNGKHGLICQKNLRLRVTWDELVLLNDKLIDMSKSYLYHGKMDDDGFNDWYLPTTTEFKLLFINLRKLNKKVVSFPLFPKDRIDPYEQTFEEITYELRWWFWCQATSYGHYKHLNQFNSVLGDVSVNCESDHVANVLPIRAF
jgi:hypothetical protein